MTNQEAGILLERTRPKDNNAISLMLNEALTMAIKALEQEPSGDLISRQAVLDIAKSSKSNWIDNSVLFKKVNELPSVNPQSCDDAISRQAVMDIQAKYAEHIGATKFWQMRDDVKALPTVMQGHWINAKVGKMFPSNDYKCSECGNILDFDGVNCGRGDANYCPNCGARMVEPQEERDKE